MPVSWDQFEAVDAPNWSDFEAVEPPVKRNKLGESKEDLAWQLRNARMEGKLGNFTTDAITGLQNTAEVGADPIGSFSRLVSPVLNKLAGQRIASDYNEVPMQGVLETPLMMTEDALQLPRGYLTEDQSPVKGITDSIENTATGLTNRKALPVIPLFGPEAGIVSPVASTVGKVLLGGEMAHGTTEAARNFGNVIADPDSTMADKANALTGAGTAFAMTGATAGHALPKVSDVPIPDFSGRDLAIPEGFRVPEPPPAPKAPKAAVPETPAEPQKGMTALEEIRNAGAKTKEDIRKLYPQLTREQAAQLRNQAWGEPIKQIEPPTEPEAPAAAAPIEPEPVTPPPATPEAKPFEQAPEPEKFDSLDDLLAFRKKRIQEEKDLYQREIGLTPEEADKLQNLHANDRDTTRFEKGLDPEKLKAYNRFFDESPYNKIGGPFEFWDHDRNFNPEELTGETDKNFLATSLISAVQKGLTQSASNDRFLYAAIAAKKLKSLGATKSDVARALDKYTTRNSGSQGDKAEFFKSLGTKVNDFLSSQGADLDLGDLGKGNAPATNDRLITEAKQGKFAVTPEAESLIQEILGQPSRDSQEVEATKAPEPAISDRITQKIPTEPTEDLQSQLNAEMGDSNVSEPAAPEAPASPVAPEPVPEVVQATAKAKTKIAEVAATEGERSAKDIKSELVSRIEDAIENPVKGKKVVIDIPDDGKFTIFNNPEDLGKVLVNAKRIATNAGKPERMPSDGSAKAARTRALRPLEVPEDPTQDDVQSARTQLNSFEDTIREFKLADNKEVPIRINGQNNKLLEAVKTALSGSTNGRVPTIADARTFLNKRLRQIETLAGEQSSIDKAEQSHPVLDSPDALHKFVQERKAQGKPTFMRVSNSELDLKNPDYKSKIQKKIPDATHEIGMSTIPLWTDDESIKMISPKDMDTKEGMAAAASNYVHMLTDGRGKHVWLLEGDIAGVGYDGEPLIKNAKKVAEVTPETAAKLYTDWAESTGDQALIGDVKATAARMIDASKKISKAEKWANDKLKGGGTSSGPDVLAAYAVKGAITIARGIKDFGEWSASMLKELGEAVRPHLQDIWERVKGEDTSPKTADEIMAAKPGSTTVEAMAALSDEDAAKVFNAKKEGGAQVMTPQKDSVLAGMKLTEKDVPRLEALRDEAGKKMMAALKANDQTALTANFGKNIWYSGAIEGAKRKGANYDFAMKQLAEQKAAEPAGLAKNVRNVSGATGEGGFLGVDMAELAKKFKDGKDATVDFTKQVTKETMGGKKMNDLRKSVLDWSAKLQRSFGESSAMQKDLLKQVPDIKTRQGIVNWIQADGDTRVLTQRLAATADKHLAEGYRAALALTPEQIRVANQVKAQYADLARKANHYDLLNTFKDNYVTQLWDLKKGPTGGSSSRTLRDKFRFSKASSFPTYFDGEQAGFTPKGDKDIAKILPVYMHEMNTVIAARELVKQAWGGKASDGRPLLAPVGVGVPVDNASGHATLIMPKAMKEKTSDYKVIPNQPALSAWRFAATDSDGRPVMLKADLAVHPEAVGRLKAILGRSAIREWYDTPTSATAAIPKAIAKGLDQFQSTTKRTMLGLISPFHQVQEGTHAVGHRVNPFFGIPKIDLVNNRGQMDATRHGLMLLPDRASEGQFMEGLRPSGLVSRIPGIGPVADHYSNYLFHEYIPGLKFKTYSAILDRNNGVYAKDLRSGSVTPADIKVLSAEQTNAAFGHLNYADLARNPTIQHLLQLGLLAPDFLEARARFTGQGIKGLLGGKAGREQILALGTLAVAQATLAYTSAQLTGGQWDKTDPFSFKLGNRRYTMRSVPEDITSAMKDSRGFIYSRINPITMKGPVQGLTGTDYRGKKVSLGDTAKELAQTPIPISVKGFLGIGNTSVKAWESLAGAVGLKISRDTTSNDVHKMALDWMSKSSSPKVIDAYKKQQARELPDSDYKPLKMSVEVGDNAKIVQSVKDLLAVEPDQKARDKRKKEILREFNPFTKSPNSYDVRIKPFATGNKLFESAFIKSLDAAGKESYRQSVRDQVKAYRTLTQALYNKASDPKDTPEAYRTK